MKKFFAILLTCLSSIAVMAANVTAKGIITLTAISSGIDAKITFFESPDYINGPAYDDGADTPEPMEGQQLYFYAVGSDNNYMSYADKKLHNIPLVIKGTSTDTQYKFTFSKWTYSAGQLYKLYDKQENVYIDLANTTTPYEFTITAGATVTDRFYIEPDFYHDRAVAAGNWGTICYPELITSVEGAVVYEIAGRNADATEIVAAEVAVADMMAGKPYLFNATADAQKFYYNPNETTSLQAGANGLTGTFEQTTLGTDGYYVVKGQSFIPALGSSAVLANRAYLALTDITQMDVYQEIAGVNVRRFSVVRGATTGNGNVNADMNANGKYIMNGRFVIIREGQEYNALGF